MTDSKQTPTLVIVGCDLDKHSVYYKAALALQDAGELCIIHKTIGDEVVGTNFDKPVYIDECSDFSAEDWFKLKQAFVNVGTKGPCDWGKLICDPITLLDGDRNSDSFNIHKKPWYLSGRW